ncbi:hypothetical protein B9S53_23975 [Arthrospira sp. O9.13F]|nr:hypothetical protein B9S53_23975 [Arthrospira sp. O9.13F]
MTYPNGSKKHPATFGKMPSLMPISPFQPVLAPGLGAVGIVLKPSSLTMLISLQGVGIQDSRKD